VTDGPNPSREPVAPADASAVVADVVAAVWAEALGVASIDPEIGFFDLGADSTTVLRVVGVLRDRWPKLRVVDIFAHPSVNSLSRLLARM
jgi:hypothetical protein